MKDISITEKLILYFVFIGLIAIISVGSYSYIFSKKALISRTFDQLISLRLEKKNRIEQFFLDRGHDSYFISNSSEIARLIGMMDSQPAGGNATGIYQNRLSVSKLISAYSYYSRLYVVDSRGSFLEIGPDTSVSPPYPDSCDFTRSGLVDFCKTIGSEKATSIRDLTKTCRSIFIGTPVFKESKDMIGLVILEIPVAALNKIMFEYFENNGLGKTGETYLVSSDYLMRSNSRFEGNSVLNTRVASNSVTEAFQGKTGVGIVHDYRNIPCLSSYSPVTIHGLNWVIVAEIDEMEAMMPVYSIRNSILLISIIIAASLFIFAFLISVRITAPLKGLQRASEQISERDYDIHLTVSSRDELGLLTETFNNMVHQLKEQSREIEEEKIKRVSSLMDGQEMERQRLARDLHDGLGQSVLTANIRLEQAKNADSDKSQLIINETQEILKQIIQDIRNISNDLMPGTLATFGVELGLRNLCRETSKTTGIEISFVSENFTHSLNSGLQIYLFRITQEAINNMIKHSGATRALISISSDRNTVFLSIADNGKGFNPDLIYAGRNGILNIRERVKSFSGNCRITSLPQNGTQIEISIPLNQDTHD